MVSPCAVSDVRFEERPDGTRFCLHCREVTHDLRDATRREAAALYRANGGKLCAQVRVGPGGEVRFRAEPPARGLGSLGGAALALAVAACDPDATSPPVTVTPEAPSAPSSVAAEPPPPPEPPPASPVAPASTVAAAPEVPAPPVTDEAGIDHSTDASPNAEDHQTHRHRHAPVPHEDYGDLVGGLDGL